MSFLAGFTGCCIGLCTKLYSNALRKLPYMRGTCVFASLLPLTLPLEPWEHVLYMVVGGTTFYYGKKFIVGLVS